MTMAFVLAMLIQEETPLQLPLNGLTARCCEAPVRDALAGIPHVKKVTLKKGGPNYVAEIVMEAGYGLPISAIQKGLAVAQEEMGDAMGTKYVVDDSLSVGAVHLFKTKGKVDKATLSKCDGFKSLKEFEGGFSVVFEGKTPPTAAQVKKACGTEVTDMVLAASKDGARYSCPKHTDAVSPVPGKCPECKGALEKQMAGTSVQPSTSTEEPKPKKKGG